MNQTVGIIGDGQLGMMLCTAAPALSLHTIMLTSDAGSPAAYHQHVAKRYLEQSGSESDC